MGLECRHPTCDPVHYDPGVVRVYLIWVGGERVPVLLCEPCAERERIHEAIGVEVREPVGLAR